MNKGRYSVGQLNDGNCKVNHQNKLLPNLFLVSKMIDNLNNATVSLPYKEYKKEIENYLTDKKILHNARIVNIAALNLIYLSIHAYIIYYVLQETPEGELSNN